MPMGLSELRDPSVYSNCRSIAICVRSITIGGGSLIASAYCGDGTQPEGINRLHQQSQQFGFLDAGLRNVLGFLGNAVDKPIQRRLVDGADGDEVVAQTSAVRFQPLQRRRHIPFGDELCAD
jgi:hypothetical protein